MAPSTAEAEYIAAGACCAQLLYMRQTLSDYGLNYTQMPLHCDSEAAIKMALKTGDHGHAKHIQVRHHFIRDHDEKKDIELVSVRTHEQLVDIFTKPLDEKTYNKLWGRTQCSRPLQLHMSNP